MAGSPKPEKSDMNYGCPFTCGMEFADQKSLESHAKTCPSNPRKDEKKIKLEREKAERLRLEIEESERVANELEVQRKKKIDNYHGFRKTNGVGKEQVFGKFVMAQPVKIWGDDDASIPGQGGLLNMLQYYADNGYVLLKLFDLPNHTPAAIFTIPASDS